jgi:hypothetical protein
VNPDCTGSITLVVDIPPGLVTHSDFVIDDSGNETRAIQADGGSVVTFTAGRQFPAERCNRPRSDQAASRS